MNRSTRDRQMSITSAAARSAEMQRINRRLEEAEGKLQRLNTAIQDREAQLRTASSEWFKGIVREELAEFNSEREDAKNQIASFRQQLQAFDSRLGTVENRVTGVVARVDGLEVNSQAHATAIARLESANGWLPLACAAVTAVIVYFIIEWPIDWWLRDKPMATHIQWAWSIGLAAIVGIIATFLVRDDRVTSRVSSSASSGVVLAPQPPADQPVVAAVPAQPALQADAVIPPPPPSSGNQLPSVQAAAAANASATS
jgi:hypothetical protein